MKWIQKLRENIDWEDEKINAFYLTPRDSSIPSEYLGEDVSADIHDLFYQPLAMVRDEIAPSAIIVIEPSYSDSSAMIIYDGDKVLFNDARKAWHHYFDTEADFNRYCQGVAMKIQAKQ